MKAVTFYFRNVEPTQSSQICIAFFNINGGSNIWQDLEMAIRVTYVNKLSYSSQAKDLISTNAQVSVL